MSTLRYQQLHTQNLLSCNITLLTENFLTIDKFIKNFATFERKFIEMEKTQKTFNQQFSHFKTTTQNNFNEIHDVVDSRVSASKPQAIGESEEVKQIQKSLKQIRMFITQGTREQAEAQEERQIIEKVHKEKIENEIKSIHQTLESKAQQIKILEDDNRAIRLKYTPKTQTQGLIKIVHETSQNQEQASNKLANIEEILETLKVKQFKQDIDFFQEEMKSEFNELKVKFKLKADYSDVLKLEQMLLNIVNFSYETSVRKFADKNETKRALVFFEKKLNKLFVSLYGEEEGDKEALITTKPLKCISCTKDLGEAEGKLDKFKPWSVFPAKDSPVKDRYSGFGAGFQSIVETTVTKKGGDISYDEKGRMTGPFNLTRQVQGTLLKGAQSQSKIGRETVSSKFHSRMPQVKLETNYMTQYGKSNEADLDLKQEYMQKQRGLMSHIKYILDENVNT